MGVSEYLLHKMANMMLFLGMLLMIMMVTISEVEAQKGQEELSTDYMESERVIEADAGKEAFNGMLAAVNTADERMKGFTGELEKAINKAEEKWNFRRQPLSGTD